MNLDLIIEFVKKTLQFDHSGHDFNHTIRVVNNAYQIIPSTNAQEHIVITSCYLHDCVDYKLFKNLEQQNELIKAELKKAMYNSTDIDEIMYIINHVSFSKGNYHDEPSINLQVVRDADRLDALGANGIIRTIQYGASQNVPFYESDNLIKTPKGIKFNKSTKTTLSHFYDKLFLLPSLMHTKKGKALAKQRVKIMEAFIANFYDEISK